MSPSAQHILKQLKEIFAHKMKTNQGASIVSVQVEHRKEVLDPDNTRIVLSTVPITIKNIFGYQFLAEVVRLLNAIHIRQSPHVCVPSLQYSIPGLRQT